MAGVGIQTFGERLHEYQLENGLQTGEIARRFSVDPNFIRLLIRGLRYPGKDLLRKFCTAFGEPAEKWTAVLRWQREDDPELRPLLAGRLLREWEFPNAAAPTVEGGPAGRLFDPRDGASLPVFEWNVVEKRLEDATGSAVDHESDPTSFWICMGDRPSPESALDAGDLVMVTRNGALRRNGAESVMAVAFDEEIGLVLGRVSVTDTKVEIRTGAPPNRYTFARGNGLRVFKVCCILKNE